MGITIEIRNVAEEVVEINIEGHIGVAESWQFENSEGRISTYESLASKIDEIRNINAKKVRVNIRSMGGDVNDALLIFDTLASLDAEVTTCCYGYTASAATIIAQAASEGCREMSENGLYLIHQSICSAEGNAEALGEKLELLRKTDERIASIYASRSGREIEHFAELMAANNGHGRWLSADEAIAYGLVDAKVQDARPTNSINPEALGLPALPLNENKMDSPKNETSVGRRFLEWLGISDKVEVKDFEARIEAKEKEVADLIAERDALKTQVENSSAEIENLKTTVQNLREQLEEKKAMELEPTITAQQVQDPEPQPTPTPRSANEVAYDGDAAKFRK